MGFMMQGDLKGPFNSYYVSNPIDFSKYDSIEMSEDEIENLFNDRDMEKVKDGGLHYLYRPSLPEFALKILDVDGTQKGKILFKNTCFNRPFEYMGMVMYNAVDIFMYDYMNETPTHQMTIGYGADKKDKKKFIYSYELSMDESEFAIITEDGIENENVVDMKKMKFLYMLIQRVLYERPTVFVQSAHREIDMGVKIKKTKKQTLRKRVVKTIRVLQLNQPEYNTYLGKHKVITCPSWGVIGHTRTLKSGKQIWIKPYRKGKERNNPEAYSAKQYEVVTSI